jgi:hypothetical protein
VWACCWPRSRPQSENWTLRRDHFLISVESSLQKKIKTIFKSLDIWSLIQKSLVLLTIKITFSLIFFSTSIYSKY